VNELALWEEMVRKLHELEEERGMERLFAEFWGQCGVAITVPSLRDGRKTGYTLYLSPQVNPLRVTWGEGNGPHDAAPFGVTRRLLRHIINEVEEAVSWQKADNAEWNRLPDSEEEWAETSYCPCGLEREQWDSNYEVHEVWFTEPPCGHHGYE